MCFARIFSGQPGVTPLSGQGRPENAGQSPTWAKGRPKMGGIIQLARARMGVQAAQSTGGPSGVTGTPGG